MNAKVTATIAVAVAALMVFAAAGATTYSWFSDSEEATINVTTATVDMNAKYGFVMYDASGSVQAGAEGLSLGDGSTSVSLENIAAGYKIVFNVGNYVNESSAIALDYYLTVTITGINLNEVFINGASAEDDTEYLINYQRLNASAIPSDAYFTITTNPNVALISNFSVTIKSVAYQAGAQIPVPSAPVVAEPVVNNSAEVSVVDPKSGSPMAVSVTNAPVGAEKFFVTPLVSDNGSIALDLNLKDSDESDITSFADVVTITVEVPYEVVSVTYNGVGLQPTEFSCSDTNGDGIWTVTFETSHFSEFILNGKNVKIGEVYYGTLAEAIIAAVDGDVIVVMNDHVSFGVSVPVGKFSNELTVDFNGKTVTSLGGAGSDGTQTQGFQLNKNNNITFMNGTICASVVDNKACKMIIQNYSNLTLKEMVLDGRNMSGGFVAGSDPQVMANYVTLSNNCGNTKIIDSTIIAHVATDGRNGYAMDVYDYRSGGYTLPTVTVSDSSVIDGPIDAAAKIGDVYYATLQQAIDSADSEDTITVLKSHSGPGAVINKSLTIDFDNHIYTFEKVAVGSPGTESNGFQILEGNEVVLENGTLNCVSPAQPKGYYILIQNYADLTLKNMCIDGSGLNQIYKDEQDTVNYVLSNNSGDVVIEDSTILAVGNDYAFDVCDYSSNGYDLPTVTVTNSVIDGPIDAVAKIGDVYYATLQQAIDAA